MVAESDTKTANKVHLFSLVWYGSVWSSNRCKAAAVVVWCTGIPSVNP